MKTIGTRAQVWHGTAKRTPGGLSKNDLIKNKQGRIVSKAKHNTAKKEMRLLKYGYGTKKGKFGFVKIGSKKHHKGSKHHKGGSGYAPLTPSSVDGSYMIADVVPQSFSPLDRALVGGRKRRHHKGGASIGGVLQPADVNATAVGGLVTDKSVIGLTDYPGAGSDDVQFAAGQSGGRRRRSRRHHRHMRGGTTSRTMSPGTVPGNSVLGRALGAA